MIISFYAESYVRRNLREDNPDADKITELKSLIDNATARLDELRRKRDGLKVELERMEYEGYLDEEGEEGLPQNDVSVIDAAK